jgi:hypothetical protein
MPLCHDCIYASKIGKRYYCKAIMALLRHPKDDCERHHGKHNHLPTKDGNAETKPHVKPC